MAAAEKELTKRQQSEAIPTPIPNELLPTERPSPNARGLSAVTRMGVRTFGDLFGSRPALTLSTFSRIVSEEAAAAADATDPGLQEAVAVCLALAVDRMADSLSSLATWASKGEFIRSTFARQALSIAWDFAEGNPFSDSSGNWSGAIEWIAKAVEHMADSGAQPGQVQQASATAHPLPDDVAQAVITDPPYYDAVPYGDLSEFFFVWLKRSLAGGRFSMVQSPTVPKDEEAIWNPSRIYSKTGRPKDEAFYETQMRIALAEARRVTVPSGIGVVVFAHKTTAGWEAVLSALLEAGWIATASWPIDTERASRTNALGTASLASSVHIVCRPRENPDGSLRMDDVGDWRDVLVELPKRIHEWMPKLAHEGVVGADAIFACLGPALEVFSRYSRVEDAAGNPIKLRTYLEKVWEAVAKEALSVIFSGADAAGFEPDARLTAMWLWTLFSAATAPAANGGEGEGDDEDEDDESAKKTKAKVKGFALEYDAARKIAQGLGADLEKLDSLVEIKGETARLLSVDERRKALFGKVETPGSEPKAKAAKKKGQLKLGFKADPGADADEEPTSDTTFGVGAGPVQPGASVLDRVHQAMILFGANQSAALKRFLVEGQVGKDSRFWSLADHLSKLYPAASSEKRLVDGVLARKKGLGF